MDNYILTCFHHGGCVVGNPNPTYQREVDVFGVVIDKNDFSLVEFLSYTKDHGYTNVKGFYCEDNDELVQVTSDTQLLEFVKDLVDGDEFHVYVVHKIDELEELPTPGLLPWSGPVDESMGINTEGTMENDSDLNEVDTELPGGDTNQNEAESYLPSSDTDVDAIPNEDDSDVDEELRSLRAEKRNKKNPNPRKKRDREKKTITNEVPIGEAGVDRCFEDIRINKKDRYIGRLGGDEKYIVSSKCDSDDSTDMLDAEAVGGVDLPGRRKRKKVRYDDECTVAIFELGMIFENAKEFRKALAKYVVEKHYQIKLRPNEAHKGSQMMDRETVPRKNLFVYFYVCLDALKKGWKEGCKRIIGFDGCFLKGACKGELLVAVGRNGNNQMFPIA
ncbi:hypothetical protein RDI58_010922 [Solanum bulbocastanum]|uniref:PB1-like domain-containing protein n=1 Tax=Solanum bulbocastanum TaxID=147425 RepID=A0AAN8TX78_SOLBU